MSDEINTQRCADCGAALGPSPAAEMCLDCSFGSPSSPYISPSSSAEGPVVAVTATSRRANPPLEKAPRAVVHRFSASLEQSHVQQDASWWEDVYRRGFHGFEAMHAVRRDGWAQRGGIDRQVVLDSGRVLMIEEKVRDKAYPDFALERWSNLYRRTPGWIQKDLACDFVAYAVVPSQKCWLLPFQTLRAAWIRCGASWIALAEHGLNRTTTKPEGRHKGRDGFWVVWALNEGYVTESIAVPTGVLLAALAEAMCVPWEEAIADAA